MAEHQQLKRQLGVFGATLLGLGSILGTGVFVSIGIVAGIVGSFVVTAVVLAGLLAWCNALSSAQLAAAHPVAGGTYEYGYKYLHPTLGFTAGWMFLAAKSASAATAALGITGYLAGWLNIHDGWAVTAGALAVVALMTALVLCGVRRSNVGNAVLIAITLAALGLFVALGLVAGGPGLSFRRIGDGFTRFTDDVALMHATALMFVAYTGYGRIATMGEEVHHPRRTIPAAIIATLAVSALVYVAVGLVVAAVDTKHFAGAPGAPLEAIVASAFEKPALAWVMAVGACAAMGGVLLNLLLGLSRVVLAMARRGDAPGACARVNATGTTPTVAVLVVGVIIAGLVMVGDVKATWTFSAFTVLIYYGLTNAAALRLPAEHRLYPRLFAWVGLFNCFVLAFFVPWRVWCIGLGVIAIGLIWHAVARKRQAD